MATKTQSTVVAVFRTETDARAAMEDLKASGFSSNEIYMSSNAPGTAATTGRDLEQTDTIHHHEGGVKGWFKSLFGNEDEQNHPFVEDRGYYENAVNSGNCFLTVDVDEQNLDTAADVLNRHSPVDVHRESGDAATTQTRTDTRQTETRQANRADEGKSIPVVQEELKVGKRAVLRGGVRVYSRVIDEPVEENVRLREEKVSVERTPANRASTEGDLRPGQERVFEVKEYAEEPIVSKSSRVVEDVRIRKDATERTETVRDTLRRTEVDVENLTDAKGRNTMVDDVRGTASANTRMVDDTDFRNDFAQRYGNSGANYDTYAPSYQYGYDMASDPRYRGRSFDEVESDLRTDYGNRYPNSTWERMKDSVRYGWNKVTGKV
jgi:uncharacterized protein (TIGR02271 family)